MVVPDFKFVLRSFQIVAPLLQRANDGKHFFIGHRIVSFFRGHGVGGECDGVPLIVFLDREDRASCEVRSVCFEAELTVVVRISEYGSGSETGLKRCKSLGLRGSPCEHFVLLGQIREGLRELRELRVIFDKSAIEVGEAEEATDAADIGRRGPFRNCFHLGVVHFDAVSVDEHP